MLNVATRHLTTLHSFNNTDGQLPTGNLVRDSQGNLTTLHNFTYYEADGGYPVAGLTMDSKGNLYGTTEVGRKGDCGVLFMIEP